MRIVKAVQKLVSELIVSLVTAEEVGQFQFQANIGALHNQTVKKFSIYFELRK